MQADLLICWRTLHVLNVSNPKTIKENLVSFTFADGRISEAIVLPGGGAGGPEAGEGGQPLGRELGLRALVLLHDVVIENVHTDSLRMGRARSSTSAM